MKIYIKSFLIEILDKIAKMKIAYLNMIFLMVIELY